MSTPERRFVSRGGLKLQHAIDHFGFSPAGLRCADFGANVGGFTDCLLQAGAAHVTSIDTGYGTLAWTLRNDPRVTVLERTNALHAEPPAAGREVDLVVIDLAWTPQRLCVPAALRWLHPGGAIITLIKPHYEQSSLGRVGDGSPTSPRREVILDEASGRAIADRVLLDMPLLGAEVIGSTISPILGGAGKAKGHAQGNREWLAMLRPAGSKPG
jgi:23S rRNA (cytidine1920-2'-O)/16S rRNA (cytidine1409-2'-O)-methyltransferase